VAQFKRTAGKIVRGRLHAAPTRGGNGITRGAWREGVTTDENRNIVEVHGYTDPDCLFSCHLLNTFFCFSLGISADDQKCKHALDP